MPDIVKKLSADMTTISQLQGTCNNRERNLRRKLTKLEAVDMGAGIKFTAATFPEYAGDEEQLGKTKLTAGGAQTAFIGGNITAVSLS